MNLYTCRTTALIFTTIYPARLHHPTLMVSRCTHPTMRSGLLVLFDVACLLRLIETTDLITVVPFNVNIMNVLFVLFEVACLLRLVGAAFLIAAVPHNIDAVLRSLMILHVSQPTLVLTPSYPTRHDDLALFIPFHTLYFLPPHLFLLPFRHRHLLLLNNQASGRCSNNVCLLVVSCCRLPPHFLLYHHHRSRGRLGSRLSGFSHAPLTNPWPVLKKSHHNCLQTFLTTVTKTNFTDYQCNFVFINPVIHLKK
mmetsp:Transcript_12764/g.23346  ORF Transcript_12764/g.23346 Transcript_12764/m.23346 type:complete len:253 (-) Transcript_12764:224-982(-)